MGGAFAAGGPSRGSETSFLKLLPGDFSQGYVVFGQELDFGNFYASPQDEGVWGCESQHASLGDEGV